MTKQKCDRCGDPTQRKSHVSLSLFCPACILLRKEERTKRVATICIECGVPVLAQGRASLRQVRRAAVYCSMKCKEQRRNRIFSQVTHTETLLKRHSERMQRHNPMWIPEVKEKANASRRLGDWRPPVRGGNGKGPTAPQQLLALRLGWEMEHIVLTAAKRGSGFPTNYKLDIANPTYKIGIEVDGHSHAALSRRAQDQKKDAFLSGLGWTILRFSNKTVTQHLEACVQTVLSTILKLKAPTPTLPTPL